MKRDPKETAYNAYLKSRQVRKIFPIFYTRCDKCGMEVKFETMYQHSMYPVYFEGIDHWRGCTKCFNSLEEFDSYTKDHLVASKKQFNDPVSWYMR